MKVMELGTSLSGWADVRSSHNCRTDTLDGDVLTAIHVDHVSCPNQAGVLTLYALEPIVHHKTMQSNPGNAFNAYSRSARAVQRQAEPSRWSRSYGHQVVTKDALSTREISKPLPVLS